MSKTAERSKPVKRAAPTGMQCLLDSLSQACTSPVSYRLQDEFEKPQDKPVTKSFVKSKRVKTSPLSTPMAKLGFNASPEKKACRISLGSFGSRPSIASTCSSKSKASRLSTEEQEYQLVQESKAKARM